MKKFIAPAGMALLFIVAQAIAAFVAVPFKEAGYGIENPEDPMNIVYIFVVLIVFTIFILIVSKYKENLVKYIVIFFFFIASIEIFTAFFHFINESLSFFLAIIISITMLILLIRYPEWYIIDLFGVFLAGGIAAIFASLPIAYIIILLIILAIYDAISVYKTKHMVRLAETVVSSHLPLLMIFPKKSSYSYLKDDFKGERDAFYMGLGDIVVPGMLITASFLKYGLVGFFATLCGALAGFIVLAILISKGPQPGLPYLNGGAIIAYAILYFL